MFELLFVPMAPFLLLPASALAPAALFGWLYWRRPERRGGRGLLVLAAAAVWALYAGYETAMHAWSLGVIAPIRVDLLLVVPGLYAITILAVVALAMPRRAGGAAR